MEECGREAAKPTISGSPPFKQDALVQPAQPRVGNLPTELWLEIWRHLRIGHRIYVSQVSQSWRTLALSRPCVWDQIALHLACDWDYSDRSNRCGMDDFTRDSAHQHGLLTSISAARTVLARGGSCALDLQVSFDGDHEWLQTVRDQLLALLAPHAERISEMYINKDWRIRIQSVFRILGANFPRLKRLRVVDYTCDYTPEPNQEDVDVAFTAPRLEDLDIDVGAPSYKAFWAGAVLPKVRQLRLVAHETPCLSAALRLCPALAEASVDMEKFNYKIEFGEDDIGYGTRRYALQHLDMFNLASDTWFDSRSEDLRKFVLQPARPSTSITMPRMSHSKQLANNYDAPTNVFVSLYAPDDVNGALSSTTTLSLETDLDGTGIWSLNYDPYMRYAGICARTTVSGSLYDPLRDRQRALNVPDDEEAGVILSAIWRNIDCRRVTRLAIYARYWDTFNLPLPRTVPAVADPPEVANLHFPALKSLHVGKLVKKEVVGRDSAEGLQDVAWRAFVPQACEVTVRHYFARGDYQPKVVVRAMRYSELDTFEAWLGGNGDVGEEIPRNWWDD